MGTFVSFRKHGLDHPMSNGLAWVFECSLAVHASRLSSNDWEKNFAIWLGNHFDCERVGYSPDGFDVGEIAWSHTRLEAQKGFVLKTIADAAAEAERAAHERLSGALHAFQRMVELVDSDDAIDSAENDRGRDAPPPPFRLCDRHQCFETVTGCAICHEYGDGDWRPWSA